MRPIAGTEGYELVKYRGKLAIAIGRGKDRRRISTGTADPGHARVVAQEIWRKLHAPASERVSDLWNLYLADRRKDGRDVTRQESAWKRLEPVFGHRLGTDINKDDCREYATFRQRQGASLGTAKIELEYLRACLNLRYGRGNNHVWTPPASAPRDRYLTREEVDRLLEHVGTPHVRLFIILAITTGARMSALLELRWEQVDFKHRTINFNQVGREQTSKRRPEVPINARAHDALEQAARGALTDWVIEWDGKAVKSIKKAIRKAAERSSVSCSPHVFRHTAGVWMAQADVPMQKIAQFLGHTSTRVTERTYARYSPSFMKDAAAALEF
jgi:integrase